MLPIFKNIYLFYLCFGLLILNGKCNRQQDNEISQNLSEAIAKIINDLFVRELNIRAFNFHVQLQMKNRKYLYFFDKIVDNTMKLLKDDIGVRLAYGKPLPFDQERHYSVMLVDSKNSLEFLYRDINKYHLYIEGSFFIILHTFSHANHYYDELLEILNLNWQNGITHADVLVHAVENLILLFHFMPFTPYRCKDTAPVIHDKFINGHWVNQDFYKSKSLNLYGCPVVCGTWEDEPYFKLRNRTAEGKIEYGGIEGRLLEYLAEQMNFTITIRWMNDEEIKQTMYDKTTIFNKLFENDTDFVIGSFHYNTTSLTDPYAPTAAYYMSNYCFIVSSKTDAYDPFRKLLFPFRVEIWLILIFIFVIGNTIVFIITCIDRRLKYIVLGKANETPAYNMIVVSVGGAVKKDPKIPFSRFLLMLWILGTFVLRVAYQGLMFHFIRSDIQKPPPKVINDLITDC